MKRDKLSQYFRKRAVLQNMPLPQKNLLLSFLRPYAGVIFFLVVTSFVSEGLGLLIPKIVALHIDAYRQTRIIDVHTISIQMGLIILGILIAMSILAYASVFLTEKIAYDLRTKLIDVLSRQSYEYMLGVTPSRLLTHVTSDVDAVKTMASQGVVTIFTAFFILLGASAFMLSMNWRLALGTLAIVPIIAVLFVSVFSRIGKLFGNSQKNSERINRVINESIVGAMLVRVLNAQESEIKKFTVFNNTARTIGLHIIRLFAGLIPMITFLSNSSTLIILWFGGGQVARGTLSLGEFAAFFSYASMLIVPIFMLGFVGNGLSRSIASLERILTILSHVPPVDRGVLRQKITGDIAFDGVTLNYGARSVLKQLSFSLKAKTKTAIIGPTASGKTQIVNLLARLIRPQQGAIHIDGHDIFDYDADTFYRQVGVVFQDSIIFNTSVRENILFRQGLNDAALEKAIEAAALHDVIASLPRGLDTMMSERGVNLSGGQKQRLMLARALALDPTLLILDDFTARVDTATEQRILTAIETLYPSLTLISVTQKIEPIRHYGTIIVLMDGDLIAQGTHDELMRNSFEYTQIYESQQSVH